MTQESLLLNVSQAATTFGVDRLIILKKMKTKEISETKIVQHRGETKIHINELIRIFGEPKNKTKKRNQGIKLTKPKRNPKLESTSDAVSSSLIEERAHPIVEEPQIPLPSLSGRDAGGEDGASIHQNQSEYEQGKTDQERTETDESLGETQTYEQKQKECIDRYASGIAELRRIIETFKKNH